jgi:EmrB/QacA subfamily drug resistance transporter
MQTETSSDPNHANRWWILAIVGLAQLMVVLDATIVNIALPSAQQDLGFSDDSRQWVITAYALAFGSLLLLGGRIGDIFGRKRTFVLGLAGFAGASALGGVADSFGVLIAARALQGAFGALLAPAALSILSTTFSDTSERGKAFGVYGAIAGGGGAVGLLLGGILTEYLSWRWCMLVNLGFAIPAAIGALAILRDEHSTSKVKIDIPGTIAATVGLFGIVYGFSSAEMNGWGDVQTIASLAEGVVSLAAFVAIELRVSEPLLPMRVLADRTRAGSFVAVLSAGAGMFGVFLFLTYYLQETLGFSPVETGVAFLPMVAVLIVTSTVVNTKIIGRTGPRPLVPTGMLLSVVGMLYLTGISASSTYAAAVLPALLVLGAGFGLIMAPSMASATFGVLRSDTGVASALVNTSQQIGGSIGTALLSTISATAVTSFVTDNAPATPHVMAQAAVHGYTTAFWFSAAIFAVGAIATALLLEGGAPEVDPDVAPVMAH